MEENPTTDQAPDEAPNRSQDSVLEFKPKSAPDPSVPGHFHFEVTPASGELGSEGS